MLGQLRTLLGQLRIHVSAKPFTIKAYSELRAVAHYNLNLNLNILPLGLTPKCFKLRSLCEQLRLNVLPGQGAEGKEDCHDP